MSLWSDGVAYDVHLGKTYVPTQPQPSECYYSLQYNFKPASIRRSETATLQVSRSAVIAQFAHENQRDTIVLQGSFQEAKETDCVLIWTGDGFRLERLAGACKGLRQRNLIKHTPSATPTIARSVSQLSSSPPSSSLMQQHQQQKRLHEPDEDEQNEEVKLSKAVVDEAASEADDVLDSGLNDLAAGAVGEGSD